MFIQVKEFLNKKQFNKRIYENSIALHQPINDLIKKKNHINDQSSIIPQLRLDQLRINLNVLLITKVTYLFKGWYYSGFFCWPSKLPCSDFSFGNIFYVF